MKCLIINGLKVLFFFLLLNACQPNSKSNKPDCARGEPVPIYSSDYNFVKSHHFFQEGQESEEQILFSDDLQLTIRQSGCEQVRQVYEFVLEGIDPLQPDSFWITESAALFSQLASYEEKFYSFNQWSNKITQHKSEIKLTEDFELAPDIYIQIDRIPDPEATLVQIVLFEK